MDTTFDTPNKVKVQIDNACGLVSVTAREQQVTEVSIEAESPEAQDLVERATVEHTKLVDRDVVRINVPHGHALRFFRRQNVLVRVTVPLRADAEVRTASADMELNGDLGILGLKTASGDIDADGSADEVEAGTASGDVVIGHCDGALRWKSASGDLRVAQCDGPLSAMTASGRIEVAACRDRMEIKGTSGDIRVGYAEGDVRITTVSGDVRIAACLSGDLHVRSVSGDVMVGIVPGVSLSVDAETLSGTVSSAIPLSDTPPAQSGGTSVHLTARSASGDVLVERATNSFV